MGSSGAPGGGVEAGVVIGVDANPVRAEACLNTGPTWGSFLRAPQGYSRAMELSLLLIVIGIVLAILVHYALGIVCILVGLVLLIWPRISAGRSARV